MKNVPLPPYFLESTRTILGLSHFQKFFFFFKERKRKSNLIKKSKEWTYEMLNIVEKAYILRTFWLMRFLLAAIGLGLGGWNPEKDIWKKVERNMSMHITTPFLMILIKFVFWGLLRRAAEIFESADSRLSRRWVRSLMYAYYECPCQQSFAGGHQSSTASSDSITDFLFYFYF